MEAIHSTLCVFVCTHPVGSFQKGGKGFGVTVACFNFLCFFETLMKWSVYY